MRTEYLGTFIRDGVPQRRLSFIYLTTTINSLKGIYFFLNILLESFWVLSPCRLPRRSTRVTRPETTHE
ncbi:hypothetical protein BDV26DRAFT_14722 [Aspergillus bertholletiae]|uniref:Uncharacterized protein n=1 Tax=Aspergillus bertholletiae TaxID=1226010 RepID=A0A5N7B2N0_9EURO|nr:hypothetical protein BDV26DRAFT_14722 [Aspergillus bertholletiae]